MRAGHPHAGTEDRDRNAKVDALHEKLTSAVESLVTAEDWRRAMEFAARFRARSFNNTLLIWVQHAIAHVPKVVSPTPPRTYVAGFHQWRNLGRSVMKGQTGYQVFAPVTARMASFDPDDPDNWRRLGRGEKSGCRSTPAEAGCHAASSSCALGRSRRRLSPYGG